MTHGLPTNGPMNYLQNDPRTGRACKFQRSGIVGADGLPLREAWRLDHQDNLGEKIDEDRGTAVLELSK